MKWPTPVRFKCFSYHQCEICATNVTCYCAGFSLFPVLRREAVGDGLESPCERPAEAWPCIPKGGGGGCEGSGIAPWLPYPWAFEGGCCAPRHNIIWCSLSHLVQTLSQDLERCFPKQRKHNCLLRIKLRLSLMSKDFSHLQSRLLCPCTLWKGQ